MSTTRWIKPQRYLKDTKALAYRHKRQMHSSVQCFWSTSASKAWKKKRKAQSQSVKAPRWCTREKHSAGLNNIWQAKTPDLPLLFCSTGFHLNNMFPLTICKARAALVSHTQHFQPWNTISIYPNSEPESIFLSLFLPICGFRDRRQCQGGWWWKQEIGVVVLWSPAGFLMCVSGHVNMMAEGNKGAALVNFGSVGSWLQLLI